MNLYLEKIIDHYKLPRNWGRLRQKTLSVRESNILCGDIIDLDLLIEDEIVKKIGFETKGCAICRATMSLVSEEILGQPILKINSIDRRKILELLEIELTPTRLKCALLARDALVSALKKLTA